MEQDNAAILTITDFDHWWKEQIHPKVRTKVRKAEKNGVVVKHAQFDTPFISGMAKIFNETPVRQGKPFRHYGKDFETIKQEFSRYLYRENLLGAYYDNELIGFMFLAITTKYAIITQIISKMEHRDKAPTNALIAKAVKICAEQGIPQLIYGQYVYGKRGSETLTDFKRHNGFQKIDMPRYYVPFTLKGKMVLRLKLHHGLIELLPQRIIAYLFDLRKRFYLSKYRTALLSRK
jgi:hypothetical protein